MAGNIKRKEGGSLNEQRILNPNFGTNPKRNALILGRPTKKVKLGNPNQQLNAALQGFGSGYATHFVKSSKKPYTYNEQMKDVAYYAMTQGKQLAKKQQAIQTWSDRNYSNNNTKLNY